MLKIVLLYITAVLLAALLTSFVSTQIILSELHSFGISVSPFDRIVTTAKDLLGLGITLFVLIAPGFLVGFIIAKYAHQLMGGNRKLWYAMAGFTSFPMTLYLIKYFMGVTLLASARTSWGMLLAALCCMFAGWLFAVLSTKSESEAESTSELGLEENENE